MSEDQHSPRPRRRRRRSQPPPQGGRPQQQPRRTKQPLKPPKKMVDVHIRLGLEDHLVRIPLAGWQMLLMNWMLGGETVILRGAFKEQEKNIVLRGSASGSLRVRSPKNGVNVAMFRVIRAVDMRREILSKAGV